MRILLGAVIVLFLFLWVRAVIDVFRRRDLSGGGKAAWTIGMLNVPFNELVSYAMLRPSDAQIAQRSAGRYRITVLWWLLVMFVVAVWAVTLFDIFRRWN